MAANDARLKGLVAKWRERCDAKDSGMRLSDAKKEGQRQLIVAGRALAYATCATELEQALEATQTPGPCSACGDGDTALEFHTHERRAASEEQS